MATADPSDPIALPDISPSNDSSSSSQPPDKDDVDSCRICRGEGTPEEPLFYPCKCSGSIKYVHQECLMEWLSHSQKKYCELCKTSFRFTKLYDPGMPNTIPTSVFLRRAAVHILKLFLTWCRAVLVGSVWLVLLPWCMRIVWRSLFWVGDGGWNQDDYLDFRGAGNDSAASSLYDLDALHTAYKAAKTANQSHDLSIPNLLTPFSHVLNTTAGESTTRNIAKRFFFGFTSPLQTLAPPSVDKTALNTTVDHLGPRNPSLLSNVTFFNWFPSQAANRFLLDVLEGQIITLVVVVAFILIFLIREWVVQQQPVINMVALNENAVAAAANPVPQQPEDAADDDAAAEAVAEGLEPAQEAGPDSDENGTTPTRPDIRGPSVTCAERLERELAEGQAILKEWRETGEPPEELIINAYVNGSFELSLDWNYFLKELPAGLVYKLSEEDGKRRQAPEASRGRPLPERSSSLSYSTHKTPSLPRTSSVSPSRRPHMPARNRSSVATDMRRRMEEESSWSFTNVPEAADDTLPKSDAPIPDSWDHEVASSSPVDREQDSDYSSESWQQIPEIVVEEGTEQDSSSEKGKGKAVATEPSALELTGDPAIGYNSSAQFGNNAARPVRIPHRPDSRRSDAKADVEDFTADAGVSAAQQVQDAKSVVDDAVTDMSTCGSDSYRDGPDTDSEDAAAEGRVLPEEQEQDINIQRQAEPAPAGDLQPRRWIVDRVVDWMFEGVAPGTQAAEDVGNDEHIVRDLAAEAPFVPFAANEPANLPIQDPEVAVAAARAGIDVNDQDAIDDAEDLEGMLELIGMQGPLTGLFQNAMFSAVLISVTLACAIWFPYLWGKFFILCMGSPVALFVKLPLRLFATSTDLIIDGAVVVVFGLGYFVADIMFKVVQVVSQGTMSGPFEALAGYALGIMNSAQFRLHKLVMESPLFPPPTYFRLSTNSHVALRAIQNSTSHTMNQTSNMVSVFLKDAAETSTLTIITSVLRRVPEAINTAIATLYGKVTLAGSWLLNAKSYQITFDVGPLSDVAAPTTAEAQWTAVDRLIAVLAGYALFACIGAVYLKRNSYFSSSPQGQKIEKILTEILQQAGGVLKVILIISIEMLVFPLYCGLLLDVALLPLFKDANLYTRWQFTRGSPWTSGFVHWFIGTCYMFHFALFVSMCRKIMRRGVLYFIRDPDDPQFHPVRDVLERSVTTQLRKIAFSALVYGALVIVCLGGVVWSLDRATSGVLPIHWVSHAPSLELPLDLLFYNFLTPVIIKLYKPSEVLSNVSAWWFKLCARFLRLSHFLFGEKVKEQEGREVNGTLIFEGRYVRAPASDQVRIPKGYPVFVEVDEKNDRKDGQHDAPGVHNTGLVTKIYIPPWFRLRIGIFVFTIWIFAAVAGVSATILPLLFGRYILSLLLPADVEMNDIHSFSLGLYSLGALAYTFYSLYKFIRGMDRPAAAALITLASTASRLGIRALRFTYVWAGLILLIPFLFAVLIEFYGLIPLHAYLGAKEPHVVHLIQDWTLGFLYARLVARLTLQDRASRPARAFAAVIRNGVLNPNAQVATRCFLLPALALFAISILLPSSVALAVNHTVLRDAEEEVKKLVWRFAFPCVGAAVGMLWAGREGWAGVRRWRGVVRDEVYLIGERLHNFGERRKPVAEPSPVASGVEVI